jgi:hypothetical protein
MDVTAIIGIKGPGYHEYHGYSGYRVIGDIIGTENFMNITDSRGINHRLTSAIVFCPSSFSCRLPSNFTLSLDYFGESPQL